LGNNAGIRSEASIDAPMEEWHRIWNRKMRVNFLSAVDLLKLAVQHFRTSDGVRIVDMARHCKLNGREAVVCSLSLAFDPNFRLALIHVATVNNMKYIINFDELVGPRETA